MPLGRCGEHHGWGITFEANDIDLLGVYCLQISFLIQVANGNRLGAFRAFEQKYVSVNRIGHITLPRSTGGVLRRSRFRI
jgi:hypothetical protein